MEKYFREGMSVSKPHENDSNFRKTMQNIMNSVYEGMGMNSMF